MLYAIADNAGWLLLDKLQRLFLGMAVLSWMAHYLGPSQYGILSYATAFAALFTSSSSLGTESVAIRELSQHPERQGELLGTTLTLRLFGGLICASLALGSAIILHPADKLFISLVALLSIGALFQAFDVVDNWFISQAIPKYTTLVKSAVFLLFCGIKSYLIYSDAHLEIFAAVISAELAANGIALIWIYRHRFGPLKRWHFQVTVATEILRESWPMALSLIAYSVYARAGQVMLGKFSGDYEAGIYAAPLRIIDVLVLLIITLTTSLYPHLARIYTQNIKHYYKLYRKITTLYTWVGILLLVGSIAFGRIGVQILFGDAYRESYGVLLAHMTGFVFMANGGLRSLHINLIEKQRIILATTIVSAIFNIWMNYLLIPTFGALGAAWAGACTHLISMLLLNAVFIPAREIFFIQISAFNPLRLTHNRGKHSQEK